MTELTDRSELLVIGFGNPGRQDDGLGPQCAELLCQFVDRYQPHWSVDIATNYQLNAEHALLISQAKTVVFIDAARELSTAFRFSQIQPSSELVWSFHCLTPGQCLRFAESLYSGRPQAWLLAIQGVRFDCFEERLSQTALDNLQQAFEFLLIQLDRLLNHNPAKVRLIDQKSALDP